MPYHFRLSCASVAGGAGFILTGMLLLAGPWSALAHDPGLSTGQLRIWPEHLEAELTFAQADVRALTRLNPDDGGRVSSDERMTTRASLNRLAGEALSIQDRGRTILAAAASARSDASNNVHLTVTFPLQHPGALTIRSKLLSNLPRGHRQFMTVVDATGRVLSETLLSEGQPTVTVAMEAPEPGAGQTPTFAGFLTLGLEHIITGYDHLLFLFALLLMAPGFRQAAGIITSFTVAHSITLGLATSNVVCLSPRLVEPLIAASIVYVGIENLVRHEGLGGRWLLTFAFGLAHGFGFASVLRELGVSSGATGIAMPLVSFNLGVEVGQIAIAALLLPLLWRAHKTPSFIRRTVPFCSSVVVVLGAWWFLQRTVLFVLGQ